MKNNMTKGDVREMIKFCDLRDVAIIKLMFSSGMGVGDIINLRLGDFIRSIGITEDSNQYYSNELISKLEKNGFSVGTWSITRLKTGKSYTTFNTPESVKSIYEYLKERSGKGKMICSCEPLFVGNHGNKLPRTYIASLFNEINYKTGKSFKSHDMRKAFITTLYYHGASEDFVKFLLGHEIGFLEVYFKIDSDYLRESYTKFVEYLRIEEEEI